MNEQERRQLFAHGAMGIAACIGAYMVLVDGPRKKLADLRAQRETLTEQVRNAEGIRDRLPQMNAALEKATREADEIGQMGRLAREERGLFAALMALAGTHHIRVDELNPVKPAAAPHAPAQSGQTPAAPRDVAVGYAMIAVASYDDLAAFISAIRTDMGYTVIRSVRLSPVQDEHVKLVRAVIETEHYAFDTSAPAVADAGAH